MYTSTLLGRRRLLKCVQSSLDKSIGSSINSLKKIRPKESLHNDDYMEMDKCHRSFVVLTMVRHAFIISLFSEKKSVSFKNRMEQLKDFI